MPLVDTAAWTFLHDGLEDLFANSSLAIVKAG
jgi:hypothetical protein